MRQLEPVYDWIQKWPFFAVMIFIFLLVKFFSMEVWSRTKNPLNKVYVN